MRRKKLYARANQTLLILESELQKLEKKGKTGKDNEDYQTAKGNDKDVRKFVAKYRKQTGEIVHRTDKGKTLLLATSRPMAPSERQKQKVERDEACFLQARGIF